MKDDEHWMAKRVEALEARCERLERLVLDLADGVQGYQVSPSLRQSFKALKKEVED